MTDDWILSVLADVRLFAEMNGMDRLAAELEKASAVAACELREAGCRTTVTELDTAGRLRLDRSAAAGTAA